MVETVSRKEFLAGIVIPAHNEEASIARLLELLVPDGEHGRFDIAVICNGCTDRTALVASGFGDSVRVIETPEPSKRDAMRIGDNLVATFPRIYLDADVEIGQADIERLIEPLVEGRVLATTARRRVPRSAASLVVRWYYDVWETLPQVREGLFGRGVIALSEEGNNRVRALPPVMSDDLAISEAFAQSERLIVDTATAVVRPPSTTGDLIRRRIRIATGNAQLDGFGIRGESSRTSVGMLMRLALDRPSLWIRLPAFAFVVAAGRLGARRAIRLRDFETWQRDESSRG